MTGRRPPARPTTRRSASTRPTATRPTATRPTATRPTATRPSHGPGASDADLTRKRLYLVGAVLGVLALLPLVKLVGVQFTDASALAAKGLSQRRTTETIPGRRGAILDRNGVELAISVPRSQVAVNRVLLAKAGVDDDPTLREYATRLAGLLKVDPAGVIDALVRSKPTSRWVEVARNVDPDTAAQARTTLAEDDMAGALMIDPVTERVHPSGESGLRVIGTLGPDGPGPRAGVEAAYDKVLQGHDGTRVVERGTNGETITGGEHVARAPRPGQDVQVTLDRTLQYETEQILAKGSGNAHAAGGIAIVGRPATGELLAVAGVERDDATGEMKLSSTPLAFSSAFQAGSVFKLVTVASAYEAGVIDDTSTFQVPGTVKVYDRTFSDHDPHPVKTMNVDQIVAESSNVGTIEIAQQVGAPRLSSMLADFGFGSTTKVGHPAESPGLLPDVKTWTPPDLAAASIGSFQSTTVLQLWAAYNVIANKGLYVPPRLVEGTVGGDGRHTAAPAAPTRRVVSAVSASRLDRALRAVVQEGTGKQWDLPGFPVAAKTGTGRMPSPQKVAKDDDYIWPDGLYHHVTTFAGYLPADRPQVSITVLLFDTAQGLTGSSSAGPVFSDLARLSIRELSIAPSVGDAQPANGTTTATATAAAPTPTPATAPTAATATAAATAPVRSAPATSGSAATERPLLPGAATAGTASSATARATAGATAGAASTRSGPTSTTMAPSKQARAPTGTG